ncbi:MAG: hypothetical protein ACFB6R_08830 [Alphaproteobacteria bacterium]
MPNRPLITEQTLGVLISAAEQILGRESPVTQALFLAAADPDYLDAAWAAVEALPDDQRRSFAASVADMHPPFVIGGRDME